MSMVVAVNNMVDDETTESLWILFVTPSISSIPPADLVEQAVRETLTYYGFRTFTGRRSGSTIRWSGSTKRSGVEPASSVLSPTVSPASTWPPRDHGTKCVNRKAVADLNPATVFHRLA
jgi:hypothetical protein